MSDGVLRVDARFEDRVKRGEPMSRHTSWHVGGPADVYFSPRDRVDLLDDFASVLSTGDSLLVTEVYAAGEAPIASADGRAICRAIRTRGKVEPVFVEKVETLHEALGAVLKPGDVLVTMGAGTISAVSHGLPKKLGSDAQNRGRS